MDSQNKILVLSVESKHFVAAAEFTQNPSSGIYICTHVAPILTWMLKKSAADAIEILNCYGYATGTWIK